jgi:uncharacterized protein with PQ loop repeat
LVIPHTWWKKKSKSQIKNVILLMCILFNLSCSLFIFYGSHGRPKDETDLMLEYVYVGIEKQTKRLLGRTVWTRRIPNLF